MPYPPNKGDKVRSYHLLKHLCTQHDVYLGTFADDPDDLQHIDTLRGLCKEVRVQSLVPRQAKIKSLRGLITGDALSIPYYYDAELAAWVDDVKQRSPIHAVVIFSSPMAQYVTDMNAITTLVDFVDVDSAKWSQYAETHRWPMSWIYRREGKKLLAFEQDVANKATCSYFVTEAETELFRRNANGLSGQVQSMCNGVDSDFFDPQLESYAPFQSADVNIVFTGAMDYWPNVDAVTWFVKVVLPALKQQIGKNVRFHIVGRAPTPEVTALANSEVNVTGTVPDVRPYLKYADVVVAPLRIARGVQNKVLEAMAMARPVITTRGCAGAIDVPQGEALLVADSAGEYVSAIASMLNDAKLSSQIGHEARQQVVAKYSWAAHLSSIDTYLSKLTS